MFDRTSGRYTSKAERAIFFHARYESSALGSSSIRSEHLLLGLIGVSRDLIRFYLKLEPSDLSFELKRSRQGPPTSLFDQPLADDSKRILTYAAEEADRLRHERIQTEDLLVGILREEHGAAAQALKQMGAPDLSEVRRAIAEQPKEEEEGVRRALRAEQSPLIRLIEENGRKKTGTSLRSDTIPRVGDLVRLSLAGEDEKRFRVLDVHWELVIASHEEKASLRGVEIVVRPDIPDNPAL